MRIFFYLICLFCSISYTQLAIAAAATHQQPAHRKPIVALTEAERKIAEIKHGKRPRVRNEYGELVDAIPSAELLEIEAIEHEQDQEITDSELEKLALGDPSQDNESDITTSPTLRTRFTDAFGPIAEKLSNLKTTLAEKQDILKAFNTAATSEKSTKFKFPYLGEGVFRLEPEMNSKALRFNVKFTKNGKETLNVRPVILNDMHLSMIEGRLQGKLHKSDTVTVFGEEATFKLTSLEMGEYGELINRVSFAIFFKKPLQKKIPYTNEVLTITSGHLVLKTSGGIYPITLTAKTVFRGQKVRIMLLYKPGERLSAALRIGKMPLKNLIPPVTGTPLGTMQITRGRVLVDLWVPKPQLSEDMVHIPEDDPARELRIDADLEKIEEIPIDETAIEEITPAEAQQELSEVLSADAIATSGSSTEKFPASAEEPAQNSLSMVETGTDGLAQAAKNLLSDTPTQEGDTSDEPFLEYPPDTYIPFDFSSLESSQPIDDIHNPSLVTEEEVKIDADLVEDALPEMDFLDPAQTMEESIPEEEEIIACDLLNDPCCRERTASGKLVSEAMPTFSMQATLSRYNSNLSISMSEVTIPHVGLVSSVVANLTINRTGQEREDADLRGELKKKSLKKLSSELLLDLNCVPLKHIGMLEYGTITIGLTRDEKERAGEEIFKAVRGRMTLLGRMRLSFGKLGKLPIDVNAIITRKGIIFTGKLDFCQTYTDRQQSATGYMEKEQRCTKNSLSYGGLTLENVKVTYGYPRFTAPELEERATTKEKQAELVAAEKEQRRAVREIRTLRTKGETPDQALLDTASANLQSSTKAKKVDMRKTVSLIATINLWGIRLIATLAREPDPKNPRKYSLEFTAKGILREFQPFKHIPGINSVPGLSEVTFEELSAELQLRTVRGKPKPSIKLGGAVALFGLMLRANFKWVVSKKGVPGVFIYTTPQRQQSLTDLMPILQHDFFRNITCCASSFALSSVSEIDMAFFSAEEKLELGQYNLSTIRKGMAFVANVPLTGSLDQVGKWLGINKEPTESERKKEEQKRKRDEATLKRGEKLPVQNRCKTNVPMLRMLGNINFKKPQFSEFRIAITKNRVKQLSSASEKAQPKDVIVGKEKNYKSKYASLDTRFSDTSFNPFAAKATQSTYYGAASTAEPVKQEARNEPLFELDQVEIFFLGDTLKPSAGVAAAVIVRPTPKELLYLKGSVEFSPTTVTLGAQMLGTWHNAFTLDGFDLSDVVFLLGFVYGSVMPTRLGGAADLKFKTDFAAAFKFMADANISEMGFEGKISRVITIFDLATVLLKAVHFNMPGNIKFPTLLELRNVELKYAPKDIKIGDLLLEAGFAAKADFTILDKIGKIDIHADYTGFKAFGTIERIDFNLLKISSADGKGDPKVDIELSLDRQHFLITGLIKIAELIEASAFIQISSDGFEFDFIEAIGKTAFEGKPLLMARVTGKSSGPLNNPDFKLVFDFQQNFQRYIKQQATEKLKIAEQAVENEMNKAQKEIDGIQTVIQNADKQIKDAEKKVTDARNALKAIQDAKAESNRAFEEAKGRVATLRKNIEELDRWYNSLPTA